ncbi:MAG: hypothetical protein QM784_25915 [Polyangiaceae bacterium]
MARTAAAARFRDTGTTTEIKCDDGTEATISDGTEGPKGANGADGEDGATGIDGIDGTNSLITLVDEPPSTNCASGGTKLVVGLDVDANGQLSEAEIDEIKYVCNAVAAATKSTLLTSAIEPAGSHCIDGGLVIAHGIDDNGNGTLETSEVDQTQYLCKTACTLQRLTRTAPILEHASLDYSDDQTWDDNELRAESASDSDVVGWMGFDLSTLPTDSLVLSASLYLRQRDDVSPSGSPTIQVLRNDVNRFSRTTVTATNQPKGPVVSAPVTTIVAAGWNEIPLMWGESSLATAFATDSSRWIFESRNRRNRETELAPSNSTGRMTQRLART